MSHSDLFQAATQRTKLFKQAKVPHFLQVSTGNVNQLKKLAIGDFGIVWTENGLMVAQGLVLATQIYLRN
jgi:predicted XRE-type DNA-binding protein